MKPVDGARQAFPALRMLQSTELIAVHANFSTFLCNHADHCHNLASSDKPVRGSVRDCVRLGLGNSVSCCGAGRCVDWF